MEVFTVVEQPVLETPEPRRGCAFKLSYIVTVFIQSVVAILEMTLLLLDLCAPDTAKDLLPTFGRLMHFMCLVLSFYSQHAMLANSEEEEVPTKKLTLDLFLYTLTLICGNWFWMMEMQFLSQLSPSIANYTAIEPVLFTIGAIVGFYYLRRLMDYYEDSREVDDNPHPYFHTGKAIIFFSISEAVFGLTYATVMSLIIKSESEYPKRCLCILALFLSLIINEYTLAFCKEERGALIAKSMGFFVTLVCSQFTWWASYSTEVHINLYGLSVGFIGLLFGILYTIEMSLIIAQLHGPPPPKPPKPPRGSRNKNKVVDDDGGFLPQPEVLEVPEEDAIGQQPPLPGDEISDSETTESQSRVRIINQKCVAGVAVFLQIALGLVPVATLISFQMNQTLDSKKENEGLVGNWTMWAVGFFASILLNEIILFQEKVYYLLVCICNGAFCVNFCVGCVISYQGLMASMGGHPGVPMNLIIVGSVWIPYFVLCHVDFIRLTRFSLNLEKKQIRRSKDSKVSLFVASGIQSMVAVAALIPATDFVYFPGKIFTILTFPSLAFIAEVVFHFGKRCRGPFLVTFTAFFLGSGYGQVVWYISVIVEEEGAEDLVGLSKGWLLALGGFMGVLTWIYILRFLIIIITKWDSRD